MKNAWWIGIVALMMVVLLPLGAQDEDAPVEDAPAADAPAEEAPAADAPAEDSVEWPKPDPDWAQSLKVGTQAVYSITMGENALESAVEIKAVEAESITVARTTTMGENAMPPQEEKIDLTDKEKTGEKLPDGATLKRLGEETITAAGRDWDCTIYEVVQDGATMKIWHSSDVAPIFMGGAVKMEATSGPQTTSIMLKSYTKGE